MPQLHELLRERSELRPFVGFGGVNGSRIAWIKAMAHSKYDVASGQLICRPDVAEAYTHSWRSWFSRLPDLVRANESMLATSVLPLPAAAASTLNRGWVSCRSWECARRSVDWLSGSRHAHLPKSQIPRENLCAVSSPPTCFKSLGRRIREALAHSH